MQSLPRRLSAVAGLPPAVKDVLDDEDLLPAALADRLEAAPHPTDTPVEPTWNLLGRLIRDEALVMAYRRLQFLDDQLGLPTSEEYEMFRAMIGEHPLAAALEGHADAPDAAMIQAAAQFNDCLVRANDGAVAKIEANLTEVDSHVRGTTRATFTKVRANAETLCETYDWYLAHRGTMRAAGTTHRVPWDQRGLAALRRLS